MSQVGRADLLRALAKQCASEMIIEDDGQSRWVYRSYPKVAKHLARSTDSILQMVDLRKSDEEHERNQRDADVRKFAKPRLPLRMPSGWTIISHPMRPPENDFSALPQLTADDLVAETVVPEPYRDLVPWARAFPRVRRHCDHIVAGSVDWPRLISELALRKSVVRLPRRSRSAWPPSLILVLDLDRRLAAFHYDFHRLAEQCASISPIHGIEIRVVTKGPNGGWRHWTHARHEQRFSSQVLQIGSVAWKIIPGTTVVVASDLGIYAYDKRTEVQAEWLVWGNRLRHAGARMVVLAPVGRVPISWDILRIFDVVRWSPDSHWARERPRETSYQYSAGLEGEARAAELVDQLLAMAAMALRVDPPLLRKWCGLLVPGGSAELEGRLWNHPHIEKRGLTCSMRSEFVDAHLGRLSRLPRELVEAGWKAIQRDHEHLRRSMNCAEKLRYSVISRGEGQSKVEAISFVKRLLHGLTGTTLSWDEIQIHLRIARLIQTVAVGSVRAQDPFMFAMLDDCVDRWRTGQIRGGGDIARPSYVGCWIQHGEKILYVSSREYKFGQRLVPYFELINGGGDVWVKSGEQCHWLDRRESVVALRNEWLMAGEVELGAGLNRWDLRRRTVPPWVEGSCQRDGQLFLCHTAPNGDPVEWSASGDLSCEVVPSKMFMGTDSYGLFVDATVLTHKRITFRLRYIPAGRFAMGSAYGDGDEDEYPRHEVLLTKGFWLGDTPCTQALWGAVMGDDSRVFGSRPIADEHPVINIGWNEAKLFLERLAELLPRGCQPTLPTEAEWEYAARAGTSTAYWWGNNSDDLRANWNGQRGGTTPVHRYEPNPWGLHDMHGNVWEWCRDDKRDYKTGVVCDPVGSLDSYSRASRGGSWFITHREARSASRDKWALDARSVFQGFRVALKVSYESKYS